MSIVLDTDILIDLEKGRRQTKSKLEILSKKYPSPPHITFINLFEFLFGIKVQSEKKKVQSLNFAENFGVLHTTDETSKLLADLKFKYDKKGIVLSMSDLIVASLVIENKMILVTRDRDFEKIEELEKEIIEL